MSIRKKLLPTFNAIAAGATATVDLPLGLKYHVIWLELSDNGVASMDNQLDIDGTLTNLVGDIRVKLNGKTQRTFSATQLNDMNLANGQDFAAHTSGVAGTAAYRVYLPIFFAEPWRLDNNEQLLPCWEVNGPGITSFQIEVDIVAGLVTPGLSGFYEYEPATGTLGAISKVIRLTLPAVGTTQDFNTIDRRDFLQAIHLFSTSDGKYVNKVRLTANGTEIQDLLTSLENQAVLSARNLQPDNSAAPRFDLVLDYNDPINGALNTNGLNELTLHVEYNAAAAGNMVCLIVRAGPPE
jgi:hypothetical protein